MTLIISVQHAEIVREMVLDELRCIRTDELQGESPDQLEVQNLLEIYNTLGTELSWDEIKAFEEDELAGEDEP